LGTKAEPVLKPQRAGDVRDSLADITRARDVLGYSPRVNLPEGLRRTVEFYRTAGKPAV
jgi:UDP-glucose 4-epimerase